MNNKAWQPSREPSRASRVSSSLSLFLLPRSFALYSSNSPTLSLFWTTYSLQDVPSSALWLQFLTLNRPSSSSSSFFHLHPNLSLSLLLWLAEVEGVGGQKPQNLGLSFTRKGVSLRLGRFMAVSHVAAFKEPGFKNVGHLK